MHEIAFPLVGVLLVFAVVLPLGALLARGLLLLADRMIGGSELHALFGLRYVLLLASSAVPLAWFASASLHQAESGRSAVVCLAGHSAGAFCPEAAFFAGTLVLCTALFALPRLLGSRFARAGARSAQARACMDRLARLVSRHPALAGLRGRVGAHDRLPVAIATVGIVRPRVLVSVEFAGALDDDALVGALHHELEHVRDYDPLRYLLLWWALAVNPLGRFLLEGELARWLLSRELHCDREAVVHGAHAPALAEAIVAAARPHAPAALPALGSLHVRALALRVDLLLAYAETPPARCGSKPVLRLVLAGLAVVALLPHASGTLALDLVHVAAESAAGFVIGR